MAENINKMKNMVLNYDNDNFIFKKEKNNNIKIINLNSTNSGNDTNISMPINFDDEQKNNSNNKDNLNKNVNKDKKEYKNNIKGNDNGIINFDDSDDYLYFIKKNQQKEKNNNNTKNEKVISDTYLDIKFPIYSFDTANNLYIKEECNNLYYEELNIENKNFSFQILPEIAEKEISVWSSNKDNDINLYFSKEKCDIDNENIDCYSKITNQLFQLYPYQPQINI